jgi:flagellar L-ring protein precursor FlgH
MKLKLYSSILISFFLISCSSKSTQAPQSINLEEKPKEQVILKKQKVRKSYKGTLYSREGSSLFADKKDLQIGDILQVNISEALQNTSKNTRDLSKVSSTALGGGVLAPVTGVTNIGGTTKTLSKINNTIGIGLNSNSANKFAGSSTLKFDETFTTTVSVVITRIYQNGNYFINGSKEMLINQQKQKIAISGIIRPYDISPTNTVISSQIANLKVLYKKDGDDSQSLEKPWGSKILESIWPF